MNKKSVFWEHFKLRYAGVALIVLYQKTLSRLLPPSCRFYPSCSEYARIAFTRFGFFKALYLSTMRLLRCAPWHPGGYDPVPEK